MDKKVSFALSTYTRAEEFQEGLESLYTRCPLILAREYLAYGVKSPEISEDIYQEIDALQAIRKAGIQNEMKYVRSQLKFYLQEHPEKGATPEEFLGADVVSGDSIRLCFDQETYAVAPSLQVYELFMWIGLQELKDIKEKLAG